MLILGIDPGYDRLGWGLVDGETMVASGCLQTQKTLSEAKCLTYLYNRLTRILKRYRPQAMAVESLFFFTNQTTAIKVAQVRGVILFSAEKLNIPTFSYTPLQVKMAVTGYGKADKHQVQQMVKAILHLSSIPRPDDVADALALALTHSFTHKLKANILKA